ncbi:MAG: aminotransferase DegT [Flavobacteriaceae bacterium]|nr:aminotransferase DegT [Flavobacteriaceae bacterium]|tara:strand:- start:53703 stop:54764 length:1062 start_codon:yes stop_codon:yes gene_type:complete
MIQVTKTFLPPQADYQAQLQKAWDQGWVTNRGTLVKELEATLQDHLQSPPLLAMTNGTLPLQIAIKALGLTGEIITTPFSYVATTSSVVWEGCTPVFVDIHPEYLTLDETLIEAAITPKTTAILATHVFGNPCHVTVIEAIAAKHGLQVIYDAAHAFGVTYQGKSIFHYGDVSTCSFHATKLFHTGEGGGVFCKDSELYQKLFYHHNFGHEGQEAFQGLGINAKMSELQAALGLAVLPYMPQIVGHRKKAVTFYQEHLSQYTTLKLREGTQWNYAYYPIIFDSEALLLTAQERLNALDIYPRRYFYPSLHTLPYVSGPDMPVSQSVSERILCLPLSHDISEEIQAQIVNTLTA